MSWGATRQGFSPCYTWAGKVFLISNHPFHKPILRELLPPYREPDFSVPHLQKAPVAVFLPAPCDGVAPDHFHATSNHPEYVKGENQSWSLLRESRMDSVVVKKGSITCWRCSGAIPVPVSFMRSRT